MGVYVVSDRFSAPDLREPCTNQKMWKGLELHAVKSTSFYQKACIITEPFKSKSMPDFILTCLFSKQNANHKGTALAQTGEPSMLLSGLDTVRTFVSRHATYVRSNLTECVRIQAELPLLG
jgi:hypothetical protein